MTMNVFMKFTQIAVMSLALIAAIHPAPAQVSNETIKSISMPDKISTPIGELEFKDGAPSAQTAQKLYDNLDFLHAQNVFLNTYQGASTYAFHKGFLDIGIEDNSVLIYPTLMDSKSLFLTANADTVYFMFFLNLSKGPMVVEVPPKSLGVFDDMWFHWIIDAGAPGPDRGLGGKYLFLPPGYDGPVPESGYFVGRSRTMRVLYGGRSFLENNDPKPVVELIKKTLKIYPYTPGGYGTSRRDAARRQDQARAGCRRSSPDQVHRQKREVVQHRSAEGLHVLRNDRRTGAGGTGGLPRSGTNGADRFDRHRQGQKVPT